MNEKQFVVLESKDYYDYIYCAFGPFTEDEADNFIAAFDGNNDKNYEKIELINHKSPR